MGDNVIPCENHFTGCFSKPEIILVLKAPAPQVKKQDKAAYDYQECK